MMCAITVVVVCAALLKLCEKPLSYNVSDRKDAQTSTVTHIAKGEFTFKPGRCSLACSRALRLLHVNSFQNKCQAHSHNRWAKSRPQRATMASLQAAVR